VDEIKEAQNPQTEDEIFIAGGKQNVKSKKPKQLDQ
jgi:hypothetical protein